MRRFFKHPESRWIAFLLCLGLVSWPFVGLSGANRPLFTYIFLFVAWGGAVVLSGLFSSGVDIEDK